MSTAQTSTQGASKGASPRFGGIRPLSFGPSFGFGFAAALLVAAGIRLLGGLAGREGFAVEIALYCCIALCVFCASACLAYILKNSPAQPSERAVRAQPLAQSGAAGPALASDGADASDAAYDPAADARSAQVVNEAEALLLKSRKFALEHSLTKREEELALKLVEGYSNVQIEEELGLSKNTVKTHLRHIYAKTQTHSRQELLLLFESTG